MGKEQETHNSCSSCNESSPKDKRKTTKTSQLIFSHPYKCGLCGLSFSKVDFLVTHNEKTHESSKSSSVPSTHNTSEMLSQNTSESRRNKQNNNKIKSKSSSSSSSSTSSSSSLFYSCSSCALKFKTESLLKAHGKSHFGAKEYNCTLCSKTYPRSDTLKRHILSFHENKRLYKCDVCGKSFKGHIRDHMRTHGEEGKPFGCNQCGARFNQRSQMTVHMRVHTGERPYTCKICSRSFSHSTALKLHLRMHTGEKPHDCKLCKKSFAQLPHLKKHMLCVHNTDKPYYCEKCDSFFKIKVEYSEHVERLHSSDVPKDLLGSSSFQEPSNCNNNNNNSLSRDSMPMEKMRSLLALLLKKISTAGRLKKLGFGTRLIDDVLKESIQASGRMPSSPNDELSEAASLKKNIEILLEWTIPDDYREYFKKDDKTIEDILEELAN